MSKPRPRKPKHGKARPVKPGAPPSWHEVVADALGALGAGRGDSGERSVTLPALYAEVERQARRPLGATWRATVRRTLQELLADEDYLSKDRAGEFHRRYILPNQEVLNELKKQLTEDRGYYLTGGDFKEQPSTTFHPWWQHNYSLTFMLQSQAPEGAEAKEIAALRDATARLYRWYRRETMVAMLIVRVDEEDDIVFEQWITLVYAANPIVAASQIEFAIEKADLKKSASAHWDDFIALSWLIREPEEEEHRRETRAKTRGDDDGRKKRKRKSRAKK